MFCESMVFFGGSIGEYSVCLSCLIPKN